MPPLLQTAYFIVEREADERILRVTRTSVPFPAVEAVTAAWLSVAKALDGAGRRGRFLLVDLRQVVGRNDPAFESAMAAVRPRVMAGFERVGILVQSVVGMLQIQRHKREDGVPRLIATSEQELRAYFLSGEAPV